MIDALRFAAALLVVAYHYGSALPLVPSPRADNVLDGATMSAWPTISWFGWVGVEVFFVISGYVIAISASGSNRRNFVRRRALRLLPAAWLCASLTLIALALAGAQDFSALLAAWLRTLFFYPFGQQIDPVYWTLGIECAFYAMVAIAMGRQGSRGRLEWLGIAIGTISAFFWCLVLAGQADPIVPRFAQLLLVQHGCFFALGIVIHAGQTRGVTFGRLLAGSAFFAACLFETAGHATERAIALRLARDIWTPLLIFAASVALIAAADRIKTGPGAAFSLATLGLMTYPLYLIHGDAGMVLIATALNVGVAPDFARLITFAAMLLAAYSIVRFAEPVVRARITRFTAPRRAPRPDSPPIASPSGG
jgi:peptidoglycan/LPS O-acetylase OafA/YrhL